MHNKYETIINKFRSVEKIDLGLQQGKYPFFNLHLFLKKINNNYFMGTGPRITDLQIIIIYTHIEINDHPAEFQNNIFDMFTIFKNSYSSLFKYRGISKSASIKRYISNISICILPYASHDPNDVIIKYKTFALYKLNEIKLRSLGKPAAKDKISELAAMQNYKEHIPFIIPYDIVTESGILINDFDYTSEYDELLKKHFNEIFPSIKKEILSIIPSNKEEFKENKNKTWIKLCVSDEFMKNFMPAFTEEDISKNFLHIFSKTKKINSPLNKEEFTFKCSA